MPLLSRNPRLALRALLDRLGEAGLRRHWGESHEAFATRLRWDVPALEAVTQQQLQASFGDPRRAPQARVDRALLSTATLHFNTPRWRRWLGVVDPWSWMRTR